MKTNAFLLTLYTLIFVNTAFSRVENPEADKTIDQLEYAFKMLSIQHVESSLSEDFTIDDYSKSLSRQILAGMITELPIKKIKAREVISNLNGERRISCKMVIAKYMGLFSQRIELTLIEENNKCFIKHLKLISQRPADEDAIGVAVEVDEEGEGEKREIILEELNALETNNAVTYYENELDSFAKEVHKVQYKGLEIVESILQEKIIFKLGYVIMKESLINMSINEAVLPISAQAKNEEEKEIQQLMINWVYFHEVTELHLLLGKGIMDPNTRWFRDGLADFVAWNVAKEFSKEAYSYMMNERTEAYEPIKGNADLLNWIGTGSDSNQKGFEGGSGHYAASMFFFIDLTEKYGDKVIPQLMQNLLNYKKITSKVLIKELSSITGEDIKEVIESY